MLQTELLVAMLQTEAMYLRSMSTFSYEYAMVCYGFCHTELVFLLHYFETTQAITQYQNPHKIFFVIVISSRLDSVMIFPINTVHYVSIH